MNTIANPTLRHQNTLSTEAKRKHILEAVNSFPNEMKVVADTHDRITVLNTPLVADTIGHDILITVTLTDQGYEMAVTNETGTLTSYGEQDRDEKAMNTFNKLIGMSIAGNLVKTVKKNQAQAESTQLQYQLLWIIGLMVSAYIMIKAFKVL